MKIEDLPPIAPEEAALAVIGIRPIISRNLERVTRSQFEEMTNLPKEVARLARSVARDGMAEVPLDRANYRTMLRELSEGIVPSELQTIVEAFPLDHHALAGAFLSFALQLVQQLQKMLPRSVFQTYAGYRNLVPSDVSIWRFANILAVLDKPLSVFSLMGTGALLKSQVGAVRLVYPSLSACIDQAMKEAVLDERAAKKAYELAPRAEMGARVWSGTPRIDSKTLSALQANTQAAKDQQTAQKQAISDRASQSTRDSMTDAQRALYPQAS